MILFMDSYDYYSPSTLAQAQARGYSTNFSSTGTGRSGSGNCAVLTTNTVIRQLLGTYSTLIWQSGFFAVTGLSGQFMVEFLDSTGSSTSIQCSLTVNANGSISFLRNGVTSLASTATGVLVANTWYFIEAKVVLHGSTGSIILKVNGTQVLSATNLNTIITTNAYCSAIQYRNNGNAQRYDDTVVMDTSGTSANDFLGDRKVLAVAPNGVGTYSQFTRVGGSASGNYTAVSDASAPDSDTSYVNDNVSGHMDTYTLADLPAGTWGIDGVQITTFECKDDAGSRQCNHVVRTNSTDYAATAVGLANSYVYRSTVLATNPVTGVGWTQTEINNLEAGIKIP